MLVDILRFLYSSYLELRYQVTLRTMSTNNSTNGWSNDAGAELSFKGVYVAGKPENTRWDICCKKGIVESLDEHVPDSSSPNNDVQFLCPSLCHPHIHLDKCFLLQHPKYADLEIEEGDFAEAMKLTSRCFSLLLLQSPSLMLSQVKQRPDLNAVILWSAAEL